MDYRDGQTLFEAACKPNVQTNFWSSSGSLHSAPPYRLPSSGSARYPKPVLRHPHDLIRGYYLSETGFHDVAVLQVPLFERSVENSDFLQTAVDFVRGAATDGKSKMVIDLSGNNGGDITQGFNLFRLFYPDQPLYSATRFRATELIDLVGQVLSQDFDLNGLDTRDSPLVFQDAVTPDQQGSFASWKDLYGPHEILGANMSSLYAIYNLSATSTEDDPIRGYGGKHTPQVFKTENIVVVRPLRFPP